MRRVMKRLRDGFVILLMLATFFGGLAIIVARGLPTSTTPYNGVVLPADVHVVTSRSWFQPSLFSLETFASFQKRPATLKWLVSRNGAIALESKPPILGDGPVLILVHGYNATEQKVSAYFAEVIEPLRKAIGASTTVIVYDWPSTARHWEELTPEQRQAHINPGGSARMTMNAVAPLSWEAQAYRGDVAAALGHGAEGLAVLLRLVMTGGPRSTNIVAHSMGGLVTTEALQRLSQSELRLDTIVLLAPDLPSDALSAPRIVPTLSRVRQVHVMFSRNDEALLYSQLANQNSRLGRDGHTGAELPMNVTLHDVTHVLGQSSGVHGRYVEISGAQAIGLMGILQQRAH